MTEKLKIAVAGTGYVGLSLAVLLSQHNEVHALDIVPEKVEKINNYVSPIQDVSVNLFFTSFAKQARRSRKGGFTGCANVFSPIPVTA